MKELRILLVGGGSGGHVYPLVAVAESLKEKASKLGIDLKLMMLGGDFIKKAAQESGLSFKLINAGKLRRYGSLENILDIARFFMGFFQSFWHIFMFMPDIVFTKGGAVSIAPAFIARLFFIPVYIHESDSVPGLANSIISVFAKKVFLSFKLAEKFFEGKDIVFTGSPVRKSMAQGNRDEARNFFDLHDSRPTILIIGGSQGAKAINEAVVSSLVLMTEKFNIIHQCGEKQYESVKKEVDTILLEGTRQYSTPIKVYYRFYPFLDEKQMAMAYALSDIIVSRAGSSSLFEISQVGKPAVIIPLPLPQSANNHQYFNAFEFSKYGAVILEEQNLNRDSLLYNIRKILEPENYASISEKIKSLATPEAANKIAEELIK